MALRFLSVAWMFAAGVSALSAQSVERSHQRACDGGEVRSCTLLGLIYETGAGGDDPDVARAIELYRRACDAGLPSGCTRLALAQQAPPAGPREGGFVRVGHIADAETGAPIVDAVVEIPRLGLRFMADEAGRVEPGALPRGRHTVTAGKFGYERVEGDLPVPWDSDFLMLLERIEPTEEETLGGVLGRIVEDGTGRDLSYVDVTIHAATPIELVTGPDGRFSVAGLQPGPVDVTFSLIGYAPRTTTVVVEAGTTLEVRASLSTQAIELAPIEVVVGSGYLQRSGFYLRSRNSIGTQFTRSDLDRIDPVMVSQLLERVPGVAVLQTRRGAVPISARAGNPIGQGDCRLRPYLDGMAMHDWNIDNLRPDDIEAIEIYHGPAAPIEYQRLVDPDGHYPCGVVLVWTTRGRR
jgi:hypothetical protein